MDIETHIKTDNISEHKKALINIIYTSNYINEEINQVLKPFDISIQQFNVLRILKGRNDKPASLTNIQNRMVSKMSNTTRLVDKLIDKDLVSRTVCEHNRRKVEIVITAYGKTFLEQVNTAVEQKEKELTQHLNIEALENINHLLNTLRT
ncbi:MarR family winged helix-turn-helix transcriptional regulator [Mesohalobacter halotolerans]|uniref:MarR family transcriptional regulator n=1 Tax=Mesohalobacter halotolerans TaxID=1883405 RepID=A0A4U5TP56_9FLAO|nr:MarR family transcriptional regulator [Mesohalobacter halotolerans]TKS55713.1 MarR family transcriptional regulator [Mesohalobacter halotolerans]